MSSGASGAFGLSAEGQGQEQGQGAEAGQGRQCVDSVHLVSSRAVVVVQVVVACGNQSSSSSEPRHKINRSRPRAGAEECGR